MEMREDSIVRLELVPKSLSYDELSEATGGFSDESKLGHGGFGVVYKAELKSGIQVAIKRMNRAATYGEGMKEFRSEVLIISQLNHRNLINLRGWCADAARKEYMLVYDLMPNGSLDDIMFKSAERTDYPSWPQKFNILTGVADGLDYLHRGSKQQIIHRDIKCSNILMDKDFTAKLGDFGIARLVDHHGKAATTDMAGTMGYIAPEIFCEFRFTDKADVYAFGVVMLEVACGRRVLSSFPHNMGLVQWVRSAYTTGNLLSVADKRHTAFDTKQMKMVLKVGLLCTQSNPKDRPSMRIIMQMLAGDVKVRVTPGLKAYCWARRPYKPSGILSILRNLVYNQRKTRSSPRVDDARVAVEISPVTAAASGGAHMATSANSLASVTSGNPGSVDEPSIMSVDLVDDARVAVEVTPSTAAASGGAQIATSVNSFVNALVNSLGSVTLGNPGSVGEPSTGSADLVDDARVAVEVSPFTAAASESAHMATSVNTFVKALVNSLSSVTSGNPRSVDGPSG